MDNDLEKDSWDYSWPAYNRGNRAAFNGEKVSANPYSEVIDQLYWNIGYRDGITTKRLHALKLFCIFNVAFVVFVACIVHFLTR